MADEDEFGALFGASGASAPQPVTLPRLELAGPAGKGSADAEDDAEVYIQLFGSAPAVHLPPRFAGVKPVMPIVVIPRAVPVPKPTAPSPSEARQPVGSAAAQAAGGAGGAGRAGSAVERTQQEPGTGEGALAAPQPPPPPPDEDDDFEVTLEELDTAAMTQQQQQAGAAAGAAAGGTGGPSALAAGRIGSAGSGALQPMGSMGSGPLPPLGLASGAPDAGVGPRQAAARPPAASTQPPPGGIPGPRPPPGAPPPGPPGPRPAFGPGPPGGRPFLPRQPQPIYGLNFRYNIEEAAWPTEALLDQAIKLPKQTRVTPEEYRAFLSLGHGEIFELDLDRVIPHEASWRNPSANPGDYFNYDMNETSWRHYCSRVKTYRDTFNLRNKILVLDPAAIAAAAAAAGLRGPGGAPPNGGDGIDPTLPPEVIAALRRARRSQRWDDDAGTPEGGGPEGAEGDADGLSGGWDGNEGGYGLVGPKGLHRRRTAPRIDPDAIITLVEAEEVVAGDEAATGDAPAGAGEPAVVKEEPGTEAGAVKLEAEREVKSKEEGSSGAEGAAGPGPVRPRRLHTKPPVNSDYDAVPLYAHELAAQQMPGPPPKRSRSPQLDTARGNVRWQDGGGPQAWEHEERGGGGRWEGDHRVRDRDRDRRRRASPHEGLLPPVQMQMQQPMPPIAMGGPPMGLPPTGRFPVDLLGPMSHLDMAGDFYLDGGGGDADGDDDGDGDGHGAGAAAGTGRPGGDAGAAGGGDAGPATNAGPGAMEHQAPDTAGGLAALPGIVKAEPHVSPGMPPLQALTTGGMADGGGGFDQQGAFGGRPQGWDATDEAAAYGDFGGGGDYYMDDGYGNTDEGSEGDQAADQPAGAGDGGSGDRDLAADSAPRPEEQDRGDGAAAASRGGGDEPAARSPSGAAEHGITTTSAAGPMNRATGLDDDYSGPGGPGTGGDTFFGDGGGAAGGGALSVLDLLNPMAAMTGMGPIGALGHMGPMGALGPMHGLPMPGLLPGGMPPLVPGGGVLGMGMGMGANTGGGGGGTEMARGGPSAGAAGALAASGEGRPAGGASASHRTTRDMGRDGARDGGRLDRSGSGRRSRSRSRSRRSRSRSRDRVIRRDRIRSRSRSRDWDRDRRDKERRSSSRDRDRDRGSAKERRRSRSRDRDRRDRDRDRRDRR